jgi:hypothetical protein
MGNGSHLEFTVRNSGWGRPFAEGVSRGPKGRGR